MAHGDREDLESVAEACANRALEKFFIKLGVDASDPIQMQKDFAYLRAWRQGAERVQSTGIKTIVAVIVTGILGLIYAIFTHRM